MILLRISDGLKRFKIGWSIFLNLFIIVVDLLSRMMLRQE